MVLLISCICGIVLVELKLLQVLCKRFVKKIVVLIPNERKKKKKIYNGGQKTPLEVHIL